MTNYLNGFILSFLLHILFVALLFLLSDHVPQVKRGVLLVNFSDIYVSPGPLAGGEAAVSVPMKKTAREDMPAKAENEVFPPQDKPAPARPRPNPRARPHPAPSSAVAPDEESATGGGGEATTGDLSEGDARPVAGQGYVEDNFNYIMRHIGQNLVYPVRARRMGLSGTATFSFIITMDGRVEDLTLRESSGQDMLDEAARTAILRSVPFPRPPVPAQIIIPIIFKLT